MNGKRFRPLIYVVVAVVLLFGAGLVTYRIGQNNSQSKELYATSLFSDTGLVSYYRFEGNANDAKGNENGVSTNVTYGDAYGRFGQGASFDGSTSHITASSTFSGNPAITVSAWVYPTAVDTKTPYFQIGDRNVYGEFEVYFGGVNAGDVTILDGGPGVFSTAGGVVTPNVWNYIVITIGGGGTLADTAKIYVDGTLEAGSGGAATPHMTNGNVYFGAAYNSRGGGYQSPWQGYLDDVSIFNRVLSPGEIAELSMGSSSIMNATSGAIAAPTLSSSATATAPAGITWKASAPVSNVSNTISLTGVSVRPSVTPDQGATTSSFLISLQFMVTTGAPEASSSGIVQSTNFPPLFCTSMLAPMVQRLIDEDGDVTAPDNVNPPDACIGANNAISNVRVNFTVPTTGSYTFIARPSTSSTPATSFTVTITAPNGAPTIQAAPTSG